MEVELRVHHELGLALLIEVAELLPVLALECDRLLDDRDRHFVLRRERHELHAQRRHSHDVQHVGLLLLEHFAQVGVPRLDTELVPALLKLLLVHIADRDELSLGHVLVRADVSTRSTGTA